MLMGRSEEEEKELYLQRQAGKARLSLSTTKSNWSLLDCESRSASVVETAPTQRSALTPLVFKLRSKKSTSGSPSPQSPAPSL
mmetsp:Transcript_17706/g.40059  ORF Transcript_17706/g.40059 Transcript_17706/m.40059 type:complete len:83 (+) Transcript_17706:504-752(+)